MFGWALVKTLRLKAGECVTPSNIDKESECAIVYKNGLGTHNKLGVSLLI